MAGSISRTMARIKADVRSFVTDQQIEQSCEACGYEWRERLFGPVQTIHLFVLQVLHFNTAMRHLRLLAGHAVNAAAYCEARMRLPLVVVESLLRQSATVGAGESDGDGGGRRCRAWCGLSRVLLVDGSSTIAPDTPGSQEAFGQPANQKPGCGFPVPRILGLFDALSGMVLEMLCLPLCSHEMSSVWRLHPMLGPGDLLVGDRGFCSYAHLAMLHLRGVLGLFRMHQRIIVDFHPGRRHAREQRLRRRRPVRRRRRAPSSRYVRRLGKQDQVVAWQRGSRKPKWMSKEQFDTLPRELLVRELRYHIPQGGLRTRIVTIATTLLDPEKYPREKVAELYGLRWRVETNFLKLKTLLRMRRVKSQTPDGVRKELAIYGLVYNLVHAVMMRAAQRQGTMPDRVGFLDTVRWMISRATAGGDVDENLVINPERPGRNEPRVIKDLQDTYRKMTLPRKQMRRRPDLAKR
jgi:DDE family transposase